MTELLAALRSRFDIVVEQIERNGRVWRLARPKSADDLIDEEAFQRDGRIPYWADVWTSSRVLADELAKRPAGAGRLLELGCGVGFSSLVAAGLGYTVVATDYYAEALEFVEANARLNGLEHLSTHLLDWRAPPDELGTFDIVTAADVLYERPNVPLVAAMFERFLKPEGIGFCTDPQRGAASNFADDCRKLRLKVNCFIRVTEDEGRQREIDFYVIKR